MNVVLKSQTRDKDSSLLRKRLRYIVVGGGIVLITTFVTIYIFSIAEECIEYLKKSQ